MIDVNLRQKKTGQSMVSAVLQVRIIPVTILHIPKARLRNLQATYTISLAGTANN